MDKVTPNQVRDFYNATWPPNPDNTPNEFLVVIKIAPNSVSDTEWRRRIRAGLYKQGVYNPDDRIEIEAL